MVLLLSERAAINNRTPALFSPVVYRKKQGTLEWGSRRSRHQPDVAIGGERAGMKRHAAEFERLGPLRAQRLKQFLHVGEQRIEPAELAAARCDNFDRVLHDEVRHARWVTSTWSTAQSLAMGRLFVFIRRIAWLGWAQNLIDTSDGALGCALIDATKAPLHTSEGRV
jgi:hypothetical protein